MKFVRPLYRDMAKCAIAGAADTARATFAECKAGYHPIAQKMVAQDLGV